MRAVIVAGEELAESIGEALRSLGIQTLLPEAGALPEEVVRREHPELVVVGLPPREATSLVADLAPHVAASESALLAVASSEDEEGQRKLLAAGAHELLMWPEDGGSLAPRLRAARWRARSGVGFPGGPFSLDRIADPALWFEAEGRIVWANAAASKVLGYTRNELVGGSLPDLDPQFDPAILEGQLGLVRYQGSTRSESVFRCENGERLPVEVHLNHLQLGGEELFCAVVRDLTERKEVEEQLRASEDRYRSLVEGTPVAIAVHSEGQVVYANPAAVSLLGASSPDELVGQPVLRFVHPDYHQRVAERIEDSQQERRRQPMVQERFVRLDGEVIDVEVTGLPFSVEGRPATQVVFFDVTERRRVQEALEVSEARLRSLFEGVPVGLYRSTPSGEILDANPALVELLGASDAELVKATNAADLYVVPGDRERWLRQMEDKGVVSGFQTRLRRFDGGEVWVELASHGVHDAEGRVAHYEGAIVDVSDRQTAEEARNRSEERYRSLFEGVPVGIYRTTASGRMEDVNGALVELLGYPDRESLLQVPVEGLFQEPEDFREWRDALSEEGRVIDLVTRARRFEGEVIWVRTSARAVRGPSGESLYEGTVEDISAARTAQEALKSSEERFRSLVQHAPDLLMIIDREGRVLYQSPSGERILGRPPEQRTGTSAFKYIHPDELPTVLQVFRDLLRTPGRSTELEMRVRHRDGSWRVLETVATNMLGNPAVEGVVVNCRDVTDRREAEEQLIQGALYDPLTGLANRALLLDRLDRAIRRSREEGRRCAVLLLDVDRFNILNDSLGHAVGDQLLVEIGELLQPLLRPGDTLARPGGDEFVLLLDEAEEGYAEQVADQIQEGLRTPFTIAGKEVFASVSIGIVVSDGTGKGAHDLLRDADTAMYRAKAQGRGCHAVFDPEMRKVAVRWLQLETELRRAVENEEFEVLYQPIVDLESRAITAVEALTRWRHLQGGLLPPKEFLPVAEETGLIVPLGRQVIASVCWHAARWREALGEDAPRISFNVSHRQFFHAELFSMLEEIFAETGVDGEALAVEITEGILAEQEESAARRLRRLKEMGFELFLDDFGTGYSSLAYLHRFPVDVLKIDRAFVAELGREDENPQIVKAVLSLGRSLGIEVVAEGVEAASQLQRLRSFGCRYGQGFLLSLPLDGEEALRLVGRQMSASSRGETATWEASP